MIEQDLNTTGDPRKAARRNAADERFSTLLSGVAGDVRLAVSLNEAAAMASVSRRSLENYIAAKLLPSRKIGKRRIILVRDLDRFLRRDQPSPTASQEPQ
jgi:hypothetical protein